MSQMICPSCLGFLSRRVEVRATGARIVSWWCREHGVHRVGGEREPIELPGGSVPAVYYPPNRSRRRSRPEAPERSGRPRFGAQALVLAAVAKAVAA